MEILPLVKGRASKLMNAIDVANSDDKRLLGAILTGISALVGIINIALGIGKEVASRLKTKGVVGL